MKEKPILQTISQEKVKDVCNLYTSFKTPIDQTKSFNIFLKEKKQENFLR